jgi:hypothetical protein
LLGQVVSQKQSSNWVLHAATHLHHVFHDLLDRRIFNCHVDGADRGHKIEARDDVSCILDELVQVGEVVHGVVVTEVDGEMAEGIEDGHVELVVLLGPQAARPQLRY